MDVAVIANRNDADDGFVGERLRELGATLHRYSREEPETLDGIDDVDLVVLLGSDWSVYDPSVAREVAAECRLVERARARSTPVLAICFGAQLVAYSLGLEVSRAPMAEIGWAEIESDDPALCPKGPWIELHFDRWQESPAIDTIARNAAGPQAFWCENIFAVQFHPEATAPTASRWVRALPEDVRAGLPADIDRQFEDGVRESRARCYALVDTFLARVGIFREV
jgi:GMP synthase-like glutamine amidotransferase